MLRNLLLVLCALPVLAACASDEPVADAEREIVKDPPSTWKITITEGDYISKPIELRALCILENQEEMWLRFSGYVGEFPSVAVRRWAANVNRTYPNMAEDNGNDILLHRIRRMDTLGSTQGLRIVNTGPTP